MPKAPSEIETATKNPTATAPPGTESMPTEKTEMEVKPLRWRLSMPKAPSSDIENERKPRRLKLTMPKAPSSDNNTTTANPAAAASLEPRPMPLTAVYSRYPVFDDDPVPFYLPASNRTKKEATDEPTLLEPQKSDFRAASNKENKATSASPEPTGKGTSTAKNVVKGKARNTDAGAIATPTTEEQKDEVDKLLSIVEEQQDEVDMLVSIAETMLHLSRGTKRKATVDATDTSASASAPKKQKVTVAPQPKSWRPSTSERHRHIRSYAPSPSPNLPDESDGWEAASVIRAIALAPSPRPASSNHPQGNGSKHRGNTSQSSLSDPDTITSSQTETASAQTTIATSAGARSQAGASHGICRRRVREDVMSLEWPTLTAADNEDVYASSRMETASAQTGMATSAGARSQAGASHQPPCRPVRDDVLMSVERAPITAGETRDMNDEQLRAYGSSVADFWAAQLEAMDGDGDAA
ncbi:hypothetical protein G7Y79_00009g025950 [Physcia stellaris]|nr:hypothetical protein G7Y79_00009g025950 [Physcia stellaris]